MCEAQHVVLMFSLRRQKSNEGFFFLFLTQLYMSAHTQSSPSTIVRWAAWQMLGWQSGGKKRKSDTGIIETKLWQNCSKNVPVGWAGAREGGLHGKTWRCVLLLKVWCSRIGLPAHSSVGGPKSNERASACLHQTQTADSLMQRGKEITQTFVTELNKYHCRNYPRGFLSSSSGLTKKKLIIFFQSIRCSVITKKHQALPQNKDQPTHGCAHSRAILDNNDNDDLPTSWFTAGKKNASAGIFWINKKTFKIGTVCP